MQIPYHPNRGGRPDNVEPEGWRAADYPNAFAGAPLRAVVFGSDRVSNARATIGSERPDEGDSSSGLSLLGASS